MNANLKIYSEVLSTGAVRYTAASNITRETLYARLPFSGPVVEKLAGSTVTIFGLGAGGSLLALQLARAGIGRLRLVDPAVIRAENVIRHVGGLESIDRLKVLVSSENVLRHNPYVVIDAYGIDPFSPESQIDPEILFEGADLIIAATDRVRAQLMINDYAWQLRVPGVFGGCYEEARGGEVFFTLPAEGTPCLACLRAGLAVPESEGLFDYSSAGRAEDYHGEPGFSAAVDLVTNIEAQIALGILLRGSGSTLADVIRPEFNFLLIGGPLGAGYYRFKRPYHIFWQPLTGPRPGCAVCQEIECKE